jgi:hypothetical protein
MPSVELLQKVMGTDFDVSSDPMRPAIVIVEHKIRNLEKRKVLYYGLINGMGDGRRELELQ